MGTVQAFEVGGLGFGAWDLGLGFRVEGLGLRIWDSGSRATAEIARCLLCEYAHGSFVFTSCVCPYCLVGLITLPRKSTLS